MGDTNRHRRPLLQGAAVLAVVGALTLQIFSTSSLRAQGSPAQSSQAPTRTEPLTTPGSSPAPPPPTGQAATAPRTASYDIDVTLDPPTRTINGREVITWRNPGAIAAYSIRLHLYWNAFRNTKSTWLRQRHLVGDDPFADSLADDFGYTTVTRLVRLNDDGSELDLTSELRFISPDDRNTDDRSLAAASLADAVQPGGTMRLRVEWTGKFPRNFDRTGVVGNFFFVSQWFPKLGVFEEAGWTAHQFFANSEFYADFGQYDVRMTVPTGWLLGATGVEQSKTDAGNGKTTHRYVQGDVHDFAWTTSPDFIERRQVFDMPGRPQVQMRLLLQPEHEHLADRHFAGAVAALRYYGEWYGAY